MPNINVLKASIEPIANMLAGKQIKVEFRANTTVPVTDLSKKEPVIKLPMLSDKTPQSILDSIQGMVDHEVAHAIWTTNPKRLGIKNRLDHEIFNAVEDVRIEREMRNLFRGSAYNLQKMAQAVITDDFVQKMEMARQFKPQLFRLAGLLICLQATEQVPFYQEAVKRIPGMQELYDLITKLWGVRPMNAIRSSADSVEFAGKVKNDLKIELDEDPPKSGSGGDEEGEDGDEDESQSSSGNEDGDENESRPSFGSGRGKGKKKSSKPKKGQGKDDDGSDDIRDDGGDSSDGGDSGDSQGSDKTDEGREDKDGRRKKKGSGDREDSSDAGQESDGDDRGEQEGDDRKDDLGDSDGEGKPHNDGSDEDDGEESEGDGKKSKSKGEDSEGTEDESEGEKGDASGSGPVPSSVGDERDGESEGNGDDREKLPAIGSGQKPEKPLRPEDLDELTDMTKKVLESLIAKAKENDDYTVFTTDYDVIEHIAPSTQKHKVEKLNEKVKTMTSTIQKNLERAIAARSIVCWTPGHHRGKLFAPALMKLFTGDDRVFRRKEEAMSKDVAVSLVVDCSGSMAGDNKAPLAATAAYALCEVLTRMGIKNEVIGFTTCYEGRSELSDGDYYSSAGYSRKEPIYMPIFKSYMDKFDMTARLRMVKMFEDHWMSDNVDGECVQIAAQRLLAQNTKGKIMIVLSDGYPAAFGNCNDLERNLKETVQELSKKIKIVGIGIRSAAVKDYYPKHVVLNKIDELPATVVRKLQELLLSS